MDIRRTMVMTLLITGLLACQKEVQEVPATAEAAVTETPKYAGQPQMIYKLERNSPGDDKCPSDGSNCSKIGLVTSSKMAGIQRVLDAIGSGNLATIRTTFSSERTVLASYMADQDINDVIQGRLNASKSFSVSENAHFVILTSANDVRAYRFRLP